MDKRAQIALATVVGVSALGGFYWLGTRNNATPVPVYSSATTLPPIDQAVQNAPSTAPVRTTTTTVATTPAGAPRDTVSLLPGQNPLSARTPIVDQTTRTTQVTQSGQPGQVSYVGPNGSPSLPVNQPMQPGTVYEAQPAAGGGNQISGTQTTTSSTHTTVHTASTHHYHKVHKHQKSGKVHVVRATKHTVMFAAKLPFRMRP
jgi:hypothetical protein